MYEGTLVVHIVLGAVAILLGLVSLFARKLPGRHTRAGNLYHWVMLALCLSSAALAIMDWSHLWWAFVLSVWSYGWALLGYLSAKIRWKRWKVTHVLGQTISFLAIVTAVTVTNWEHITFNAGIPTMYAWIICAGLGYPLVAWITYMVAKGHRPKLD